MTDLSPEARALLDAARNAERPPPGAKARVHAGVLAGLATGAAAGSAHAGSAVAAGAKVGGSSLTLKLLAPLAVLALGVGGAWVAGAFDSDAPAPAPTMAAAPAVVAEPETTAAVEPQPAPEVEPEVAVLEEPPAEPAPAQPAPTRTRAKPRAKKLAPATAPVAPAPSSIREELELMRAAQVALADDDGARALALVRDHAKRFPNGQLVQEREAARVRALCALDRTDDATTAAQRFVARWPRSPQTARLRGTCVELP